MLGGKHARTSTFISYSHKDKKYLQELQIHLNNYSRLDHIEIWDDTRIAAGLRWRDEIERALQCTKVAVFLVSADFLASDFIVNHELSPLLKVAEQEDVTILPVILRPCNAFDYSELAQFQAIHTLSQPLALMEPAKRDSVWSSLAERIWKILKNITPQQPELDTVLGEISKTIVTYTRLEQLQRILLASNWPIQLLKRAYRVSNPSGRSPLPSITGHADPLPLMLEDLATLPLQSDGTIPLLVFSCCLQAYIQQQEQKELQTALSKWLHESIEECQLDAYQVASHKRRASELQLRTSYYLLIMLDPEGKNLFWIRAWLLDSNNTVLPNVRVDCEDNPIPLEQVPSILNELLEQCADYIDEVEKLLIEFLLPNELLCHPVDHFLVDNGMTDIKLGIQYQVVVRSLQRARTKKIRARWRKKWEILQDLMDGHICEVDAQSSVWIYEKDQHETCESLYSKLIDPSIVCQGLAYVLPEESNDMLNATLAAGIPVALWPRAGASSFETMADSIVELLRSDKLLSLPALVWNKRIEAGQGKDNLGHHLTLLWDNPNRYPEDAPQFAIPPARKGI